MARAEQTAAIQAKELTKNYDGLVAVDHVSFEVLKGESFGLLGPNGAGKTTTIRMIYGMSPASEGSLEVLGMNVRTHARQIRKRLGVLPQDVNLDTGLNVLDNLITYASYFSIDKATAMSRIQDLLEFMALSGRERVLVDTLSGGMQRRLMLARALLNEPEILVLDEPTVGLDPQVRHLLWDRLRSLKEERRVTLVLTTHYMDEAARLCDRVAIMDQGRFLSEGCPTELILRHLNREVLEVKVPRDQREPLRRLLSPASSCVEEHAGSLMFFSDDAEELLGLARQDRFDIQHALYRDTTLEDVFLKLTGRSLRE